MKTKFSWGLIGLVIFCTLFLISCKNTAEGFGQDMEQNGKDIQQAVDKK